MASDPTDARLTPEQEKLFESNFELVAQVLNHVRPKIPGHIPSSDLTAAGLFGLAQAAQRFQDGKGATFTTFAYTRVRGAMIDLVRQSEHNTRGMIETRKEQDELEHRRNKGEIGTGTFSRLSAEITGIRPVRFVGVDDPNLSLAAKGPSPETALHGVRLNARIRDAIEQLDETDRHIVQMVGLEEKTFEAAGAELGLKKSWTKRRYDRAMALIREMLNVDDE